MAWPGHAEMKAQIAQLTAERDALESEVETLRDAGSGRVMLPCESRSFEEVWAEKQREGYDYGEDALQGVRFGWQLARGEVVT